MSFIDNGDEYGDTFYEGQFSKVNVVEPTPRPRAKKVNLNSDCNDYGRSKYIDKIKNAIKKNKLNVEKKYPHIVNE
jgi:hypothetical protein